MGFGNECVSYIFFWLLRTLAGTVSCMSEDVFAAVLGTGLLVGPRGWNFLWKSLVLFSPDPPPPFPHSWKEEGWQIEHFSLKGEWRAL